MTNKAELLKSCATQVSLLKNHVKALQNENTVQAYNSQKLIALESAHFDKLLGDKAHIHEAKALEILKSVGCDLDNDFQDVFNEELFDNCMQVAGQVCVDLVNEMF